MSKHSLEQEYNSSNDRNPPNKRSKSTQESTNCAGVCIDVWLKEIEPVSSEELRYLQALFEKGDIIHSDSNSFDNQLKLRYVNIEPTTDSKLQDFRLIPNPELSGDIGELQSFAEILLQQIIKHPDISYFSSIDAFSFRFDEAKSKISCLVVNRRCFEAKLKRCQYGAVLQRTHWLADIFDWNCGGQWTQMKDNCLPSYRDDDISLPKPHLAISFTLRSFTGEDDSDPIPTELEDCISPDSGDRCFPFFFFEAMKARTDLQKAYTTNLHSASQALYNIYNWMVRAGLENEFLNTVRVFTVVFDAQNLSIRTHRVIKLPERGGVLSFQFDEFSPLDQYTTDQAFLLVHKTLDAYAAKELHPTLKKAFDDIVSQEDERVKRWRDEEQDDSDGRNDAADCTAFFATPEGWESDCSNGNERVVSKNDCDVFYSAVTENRVVH